MAELEETVSKAQADRTDAGEPAVLVGWSGQNHLSIVNAKPCTKLSHQSIAFFHFTYLFYGKKMRRLSEIAAPTPIHEPH